MNELIQELIQLPETISYSALNEWKLCSWYYYSKNILKLASWENTVDSIYGNLVHDAVQTALEEPWMSEAEICNIFNRKWDIFFRIYGKYIDQEKYSKSNLEDAANGFIHRIREDCK